MGKESRDADGGLGDRVRHARVRRGWTREQIAARAGLSWSGIAQIESGRRRNVRPDTLAALARTLDVSTDYLVHGGADGARMLAHRAILYDDDAEFVTEVGPLIAESVELGYPTRVITSDARIRRLRPLLGERAERAEFLIATDFFGAPDAVLAGLREYVERAVGRGAPWTHIVGDSGAAGGFKKDTARWSRFESIVNIALEALPLTLTCAYARDAPRSILRMMRETHPETSEAGGSIAPNPDYVDPGDYVLGDGSRRA